MSLCRYVVMSLCRYVVIAGVVTWKTLNVYDCYIEEGIIRKNDYSRYATQQ